MTRRLTVALAALAVAAPLLAAPAARADSLTGSGTDPVDASLAGGRDIVGLSVAYDSTGSFSGTVSLRAAPTAGDDRIVFVFAGTPKTGGGCTHAIGLNAFVDPSVPDVAWFGDGSLGPGGTKSTNGAAITLSAMKPALAGGAYTCATAEIAANHANVSDDDMEANPITLVASTGGSVGPVAPSTPAPAVTAPPATPAPVTAPAPGTTAAPKPAPKAKPAPLLALKAPAFGPVKRNRWIAAEVRVENNGTKAARAVTLRASGSKGLSFKHRTIKLATLRRGKAKTTTVRVKLTAKAHVSSSMRLSVSAKGVKARASATVALHIGKPKAIRKPVPGAPGPTRPPLAGLYFTHVDIDTLSSNTWTALTFIDGSWAYLGIPVGGLPSCTGPAPGKDSNESATPGCVPYSYDASTGTLTLNGQPATVDPKLTTISFGGDEYDLAPLIPAGTMLTAALKAVDVGGFWPNQSITIRYLSMAPNGEFAISSSSFGTFGGLPGSDGFGTYSSVPPDSRGTYAFGPDGDLHLDYADGHSDVRMTAIMRDTKTGSADPAVDGFLFGGEQFYKPDPDDT